MNNRLNATLIVLIAALSVFAVPNEVLGQGGEGYLFRQPRVAISVRAGMSLPRASSDLFTFTTEQLTVEKSDFRAPVIEGRVAVRLSDRVDVMFTAGGGTSNTRSEMREWVGTDGLPIEQTTTFRTAHVTFGAKAYLMDRGRTVGRFAWIPSKFAPYVGAEGGWIIHEFRQEGEFVDFETLDIFEDDFVSDGSAPTVQAVAGLDMTINNRVMLTTEARYGWARDELGQDFVDFDRLDLAGFQITAGFTVRF
jgi:hypothetical protein